MAAELQQLDDPLSRALDDVVAVLTASSIPYALIGGLATGYRSRPRYTRDIDLILDIPQVSLPAVLEALQHRGFEFEPREVIEDFTRHHMAVLWRDGVRLDWLKPMLPVYRHVLDQARLEPGPTVAIRVATAEGLILLKLLAFRLQDQTDIESLVAANRDAIDVEWIKREWQTIFDLDDPRMLWLLGQISDGRRPADS